MLAKNFRQHLGYWLVGWLLSLFLAACGNEATPVAVVPTIPAATPTSLPPTLPPTIAPTTLSAATPTSLPASPTPTASPAESPGPTVGVAISAQPQGFTPTARPVGFPTVARATITANSNAVLTAQAQFSPIVGPTTGGTSIFGPTMTPSPGAVLSGNLIYFMNGDSLKVVRSDGAALTTLANKVVSFLPVGNTAVVYLQEVTLGSLQLKYRKDGQETVLDKQVFANFPEAAPTKTPSYGTDSRVLLGSLALSPDGTQLAYVKANLGVIFEAFLGKEHPSELWIVNLDPQNPSPRVLAPNDKEYIFHPVWSVDGNRVAFGRTGNFGTGAGFPVALWSVYKDGSRVAFLTGPDLGTLNGKPYRASTIHDLRWLSPLSLVLQTTTYANSLWLHDLSLGNDFPRPLSNSVGRDAYYCSQLRRYFFAQVDEQAGFAPKGLVSVSVDKPDPKDYSLPPAVVFDATGREVLGCSENSVIYQDAAGQVILRKFNLDGTPAEAGFKLGIPSVQPVIANFSPDRRYVSVHTADKSGTTVLLTIFKLDGTPIANQNLSGSLVDLRWATNQTLSLVMSANNSSQLYLGEVSDTNLKLVPADNATGQNFIRITGR